MLASFGCGTRSKAGASAESSAKEGAASTENPGANSAAAAGGEVVKPPFAVSGELDGLLLVWLDASGAHTASKRSEIPEASREHVRIDSLATPPEQRLDAEHVYVADVRTAGSDGSYVVRKATRDWFDAQIDHLKPPPKVEVAAVGTGDVVIYKASWCGVCRRAEAYLRERHVPFVEKDVEKDPGAQAEMLDKTRKKGLTPTGVPVIDFRGEIMLGFDQAHLAQLID
ncbi:MAG TPA: glutaredoxin domain-containing protein, partial [Polyangiales bacterium]|nr:glutaredoxin domain-containing protein [Polyangiales bacterium]